MWSTGSNPNRCLLSYFMVASQKKGQGFLFFRILLHEEKKSVRQRARTTQRHSTSRLSHADTEHRQGPH